MTPRLHFGLTTMSALVCCKELTDIVRLSLSIRLPIGGAEEVAG